MPTLLENSGSSVSIISKGSADNEKIHQHRYYTRSFARKHRSPFSICNKEPIVHLTPLKYLTNNSGFGDVHLQYQQYELYDTNIPKLDCQKPSTTKSMDRSPFYRTIRILKYLCFIGMSGLIIASMLDHFIGQNDTMDNIKDDLDQVKDKVDILDFKINRLIQNGTNNILMEIQQLFAKQNKILINNVPSLDYIKQLVADALSQYDADKTGLTDFALESSGGCIITIRDTENYVRGSPTLTLFGIPLCSGSNSPRTIIQPSTLPGECWAFKGTHGTAVIKLLGRVIINGVSLEHIPASISPTGELKTAPKEFSIWGLPSETDTEGEILGRFIYNVTGPTVQYFPIVNFYKAYNYIEFQVLSNHGNPDYTCVYRLRVHGQLDRQKLV